MIGLTTVGERRRSGLAAALLLQSSSARVRLRQHGGMRLHGDRVTAPRMLLLNNIALDPGCYVFELERPLFLNEGGQVWQEWTLQLEACAARRKVLWVRLATALGSTAGSASCSISTRGPANCRAARARLVHQYGRYAAASRGQGFVSAGRLVEHQLA